MQPSEEQRLQAYAALLEATPGFLGVADLDGRMLFVNGEGRRLIGMPDDVEVRRTRLDDYVVPGTGGAAPALRRWQQSTPVGVVAHSFVVDDVETGHPVAVVTVQRAMREMRATAAAESAKEELARSREQYRALLRHISDMVIALSADGGLIYASPSARRVMGVPEDVPLAGAVTDYVHPDDRELVGRVLAQVAETPGVSSPLLLRMRTGSSGVRDYELVANNLLGEETVAGLVCVLRDVTDRLREEQAAAGQAEVLELIAHETPPAQVLGAIAHWVEGQLADTACSILLTEPGADGVPVLRNGASPSLPEEYLSAVDASADAVRRSPCAAAASTGTAVLVPDLLADQRWAPLQPLARDIGVRSCWSYPITSPATGGLLGTFALYRRSPGLPDERTSALMERGSHLVGITLDRQRLLTRLAHQAHHDALTGLPNRPALLARLEEALRQRDGGAPAPVVVFLDLDRLKVVNDSLGHDVGDELLVQVARRLRNAVPAHDLVARFGGDEFVVLCAGTDCEHSPTDLVETVLSAVAEVVPLAGRSVTPSASAGVVVATSEHSAAEVLRDADIAMYRAKHRRAGGYELFGEHMRQRAFDRLDLEAQIRLGIDRGEFLLHYQPIVDVSDEDRLVGFEALVRWQHPERGLLAPGSFIELAEETGLIVPLGEWVLRTAVATAVSWRERCSLDRLTLSVNLAAQQLAAPGLTELVQTCRDALLPWRLGLEFTESTMMDDSAATRTVIDQLAATGAWLSIDDFGTGYSSLAYLTRLPVRQLKIDREFIGEIERAPAATVAAALIGLGDDLGLTIVAEGVETPRQREILAGMGCRFAQGYLLGRPMPAEDALALLLATKEE